jgi:ribosomal protein S18 acetylase RimI-like enzyme
MNIRLMTVGDYDEVYALWLAAPNMGLNGMDDSREGIKRYLERNPNTCFVAEEGGAICGALLCGHDGRRGFIYHAAVSADWQRKGLGTALVGAALAALKREGIRKAALVVKAGNGGGNAFWEKTGFSAREDLVYRNKTIAEPKGPEA